MLTLFRLRRRLLWYCGYASVSHMLTAAANAGVAFWDTVDIYGASEATMGKWFRATGRRNEIFLSTKFGGKDLTENAENIWCPNSQPSYIKRCLETSLALLNPNTEDVNGRKSYIDLYFQHRVDPDVPIECEPRFQISMFY